MSEQGIFEAFGITSDEIPVLSSGPEPGTYEAQISKAEIKREVKEDGTVKINLILHYKIEGYNFPQQEFLSLPTKPKDQWDKTITGQKNGRDQSEYLANEFKFGLVAKRYESLGIPKSQHNTIKPSDLEGIDCVITLAPQKDRPQYTQVVKVGVKKESGVSLPTGGSATASVIPDGVPSGIGSLWS